MITLKNYQILFDAECPMCKMYTKAFVKAGMLENNGRKAYQDVDNQACPLLDRQRAANEIALVNIETGEVVYGVNSLFKVIGTSYPALKPLFNWRLFNWLMSKMYAFISYNRRVIIPASSTKNSFEIQPAFSLKYRVVYLIFSWLITACILSKYAVLFAGILPAGTGYREYLICGGQIFFQGLIVAIINRDKFWSYLGNMMTISMAGALLLVPMLIAAHCITLPPVMFILWFLGVAGAMFFEHARRMRLLQLPFLLTASWVLYRLAILLIIL